MSFEGIIYRTESNWGNYIRLFETPIRYLEIGTFFGANLFSVGESYAKHPESELHCIEPWCDYSEYPGYKGKIETVYETFLRNVENSGQKEKITIHRGYSNEKIPTFEDESFNIIYIDGNYEPEFVLEDAVLAFRKVKKGGYLIFGHYGWGGPDLIKRGVDAFLQAYHKRIEILGTQQTQVFVKRIS